MGGPNLEVFKFAVYVFFPVAMMLHYGDPEWYRRNVLAYKDKIFPPDERLVTKLPTEQSALKEELAKIRVRNAEKRAERERESQASGNTDEH